MKRLKKLVPILFALTLVLSSTLSTFACTGFYIGSNWSENGSTYFGRSEDYTEEQVKIFGVKPAMDWASGSYFEISDGFKMPNPAHTYKYTYCKDSPAEGSYLKDSAGNPIGEYCAEIGINEKGVAMSATVSTYYNAAAKKADPLLPESGIIEAALGSVILGSASTAREGIELVGKIIDEYGAGECNSLFISDPNEVWFMEIVSGHQYAAIKLPANKVMVQPNLMLMNAIDVNDANNVIASQGLISLAKENGFLVTDTEGKIDVTRTYGKPLAGKGTTVRYWQGLNYMNKAAAANLDYTKIHSQDNPVPLLYEPDRKLTTMEALRLLAYRGEGSKHNTNNGTAPYAIGNSKQTECHVVEIRQGYPTELATIQWQAMADAEWSIYLPYYSALLTEVNPKYNESSLEYVDGSILWVFKQINRLCNDNREKTHNDNYGAKIKAYFAKYQESIISQQPAVDEQMREFYAQDPTLAQQKANEIGKKLSEQAYNAGRKVLMELNEYIKSGDKSKAFVPSGLVNNELPDYSFSDDNPPEVDQPTPSQPENSVAEYTNESGSKIKWSAKSNEDLHIIIHSSINDSETFEKFVNLTIDGKIVDQKNYTAKSGSLKLSIKADYLNTLSVGDHSLSANFKDGKSELNLTIDNPPSQKSSSDSSSNPKKAPGELPAKTGDSNHLILWAIISLIATLIIGLKHKFIK